MKKLHEELKRIASYTKEIADNTKEDGYVTLPYGTFLTLFTSVQEKYENIHKKGAEYYVECNDKNRTNSIKYEREVRARCWLCNILSPFPKPYKYVVGHSFVYNDLSWPMAHYKHMLELFGAFGSEALHNDAITISIPGHTMQLFYQLLDSPIEFHVWIREEYNG